LVITMFVQFNRTAITPLWLVVFGLLALLWSPPSVAMAVLLLLVGLAGPAAMLIVWKQASPAAPPVATR
jgi:ACR3 family arsenite efflux pump ArsB